MHGRRVAGVVLWVVLLVEIESSSAGRSRFDSGSGDVESVLRPCDYVENGERLGQSLRSSRRLFEVQIPGELHRNSKVGASQFLHLVSVVVLASSLPFFNGMPADVANQLSVEVFLLGWTARSVALHHFTRFWQLY